jgi:hypothetical protein
MKSNIKYKKVLLVSVFGLINLLTISAQDRVNDSLSYNRTTQRIIKKIEKQKYLMTNFRIDKKILRLTNKLSKTATDVELINLTDSKNRVLSCIAFWILVKQDNPIIQQIFEQNEETRYKDNMVEINRFKRYKFDVIIIYTDENFYYEVYKNKKYLDLIKDE